MKFLYRWTKLYNVKLYMIKLYWYYLIGFENILSQNGNFQNVFKISEFDNFVVRKSES